MTPKIPTPDEIEALSGKELVALFNELTAIRTPDAKPVNKFATSAVGRTRTHSLANVLRLQLGGSIVSGVPSKRARDRLVAAKENPTTAPSVVDTARIEWPLHATPARTETIAELVEEVRVRKTRDGGLTVADVARTLLRDPTASDLESELLAEAARRVGHPVKNDIFVHYSQHPPIKDLRPIRWDVKRRARG